MEEKNIISLRGFCSNGNPSLQACSHFSCYQKAFFCNQQLCKCNKHPNCTKIFVKELQQKLQSKLLQKSETIEENARLIQSLFDNFIQKLSLDRLKFIESMNYYGLKDYSSQLVNLVSETQYDKINGRLFALVNQQLQRPDMKSLLTYQQINKYKQYLSKQFETFRDQLRIIAVKLQTQKLQTENIDMIDLKSNLGSNILKEKIFFDYLDQKQYTFQQFQNQKRRFQTLQKVNIYSTALKTIPVFFRYPINIITLELNYNHIAKIQNLEHLTYLRFLNLGNNFIKIMENLNTLSQLRHLSLFGNSIKDVADIDKLFLLQVLNLNGNPLENINMLNQLPRLNKLYVQQCNYLMTNDKPLALLTQLSKKVLVKGGRFY